MRERSGIVIAAPAVAALATGSPRALATVAGSPFNASTRESARTAFTGSGPRHGLHAITPPPGNAEGDGQSDLSPDGSEVVFHRLCKDGSPDELIVVNADGSHPRNIEGEWL